jgi:hypothetical protein
MGDWGERFGVAAGSVAKPEGFAFGARVSSIDLPSQTSSMRSGATRA